VHGLNISSGPVSPELAYNAKVGASMARASKRMGSGDNNALENAALVSIHYPSVYQPQPATRRRLPSSISIESRQRQGHCGRQLALPTVETTGEHIVVGFEANRIITRCVFKRGLY
jgi:hypothetical protein